jgi:hypothetical protein
LTDTLKDTSLLATFSENHDQPRFASYTPDLAVSKLYHFFSRQHTEPYQLAKNVLTFNFLVDGIPIGTLPHLFAVLGTPADHPLQYIKAKSNTFPALTTP